MPSVTFIRFDGSEQEVHVSSGTTLMHAATDNGVDGILADCGGACSCGTCHCYIEESWVAKVAAADEVESQMLEFVIDPQENSRLSCQIVVNDDLDGLVVKLPKSQF